MKTVEYLTPKVDLFSDIYLKVREKEQRLYDDEVIKNLPLVPKSHLYKKEWDLRIKSTQRILTYLKQKNCPLKILDLGCGNGWFSNQLSTISDSEVYASDINPDELEQGNRVFDNKNLHFIYADIFNIDTLKGFDVITINSCIQYFDNIGLLIKVLKEKINSGGEIHILDSPFYDHNEINSAKKRTLEYYTKLGYPEMAKNYFHHSLDDLENYELMYAPKKSTFINRLIGVKDIPFPWIKLC